MTELAGNAAAVDIPILKKKDKEKKERKGIGFLWPSSRLASTLARWAGGPSTWLGGLLLSPTGPLLTLGAAAALAGGGLIAGIWLMSRAFSSDQTSAYTHPPAIAGVGPNGIRIYKPQDASLSDFRRANPDRVKFEEPNPFLKKAPQTEAPKDSAPPKAQDSKPATTDPNALAEELKQRWGLDGSREDFIRKLSGGGTGLGSWNNLSKNLLGENGEHPFKLKSNFIQAPSYSNSKLSPLGAKRAALASSKLGRQGVSASRAMGQLKWGSAMSNAGANAGNGETGRTYAADAFNGQMTTGGQTSSIGGTGVNDGTGGAGVVDPVGTGAPNTTAPAIGTPTNTTPWQNQADQSKGLDSGSGMMKILSILAIAAGIALIAAGMASTPFGWGLVIAGLALVALGGMLLMMSSMMSGAAQQMAQQMQNQYGQNDQASTISNCASQAHANGTQPQNCQTSSAADANNQLGNANVHQAATTESNATFGIQGGGGPVSGSGSGSSSGSSSSGSSSK